MGEAMGLVLDLAALPSTLRAGRWEPLEAYASAALNSGEERGEEEPRERARDPVNRGVASEKSQRPVSARPLTTAGSRADVATLQKIGTDRVLSGSRAHTLQSWSAAGAPGVSALARLHAGAPNPGPTMYVDARDRFASRGARELRDLRGQADLQRGEGRSTRAGDRRIRRC
jgi:hypothetical protein